jgi:hypothetical protein
MTEPESIDSKRLIAINTAVKYASLVVINVLTFFLTPYLIRTLGPTLLGLKTLAYQALQFVGWPIPPWASATSGTPRLNLRARDYDEMNSNLSAGFSSLRGIRLPVRRRAAHCWPGMRTALFGLTPTCCRWPAAYFLLIGFTTAFLILTGVWETPCFVTERLYLSLELGNLVCSVVAAGGRGGRFEYGAHPSWRGCFSATVPSWCGAWSFIMPTARRILPAFRMRLSLVNPPASSAS